MRNVLILITPEEYEALQEVRPIYKEDSEPFLRTEKHILNIINKFEAVIKEEEENKLKALRRRMDRE